jgi:acetylornithine/succinyldiaminopimelate/putrescine aminotransferase
MTAELTDQPTGQPAGSGNEVPELVTRLGFAGLDDVLAACSAYWNPGKTAFWVDSGVPLVIGRREGYHLYDLAGCGYLDVHLNGGTYNLGHRHPEVVSALVEGAGHADIGNHHFPSVARAALARELIRTAPVGLAKVIYASGGGEAIDIALKTARHATGRTRIVSVEKAYHGHTGLALCTGDDRFSELFRSARPEEFPHVPFNDLDAMAAVLEPGDVAAVIMETVPATYGFPMPDPGYLETVKELCERHGTLLHRRRGADRPDAHRRAVGGHQTRPPARSAGHRQGLVRRAVSDCRRAGRR